MRPSYRITLGVLGVGLLAAGGAYLLSKPAQPEGKAAHVDAPTRAASPAELQSSGSTVLTGTQGGSRDLSGKWRTTGGTTNMKCDGMDPQSQDMKLKEWTLESGDDASLALSDQGCTVRFDARPGEASARPGQICRRSTPKGDATFSYSTFSIKSADGRSADVELRATAVSEAHGKSLTCTIESSYKATRVSG